MPAKNVVGAIVSHHDISDIKGWHIKTDAKEANNSTSGGQLYYNIGGNIGDTNIEKFNSDDIIRFSLNDEMSDEAPFGRSILSDIYRAFKQKELLEDAIIIYRIQRAPERRVFYIDVAHVHPAKVANHLEQIRNEIKQKKVPSVNGGKPTVESIYNPQSMNEDYIFAQYKDGQGSKVETLPGGQGLGELQDLEYFYKRMWRGLRIPQSYIDSGADGASYSDGKVGIAYLQETKFSLYIERLQSHLEYTFDREFKRFLRESNILVDESIFKVILPSPSNYDVSRKQVIDNDLLNTFSVADGVKTLSKRFAMRHYLQLTDEQIIMNERQLREEKGLDPNGDYRDLPKIYNPDEAEAGGFEGGLGSFSGGGGGGGMPPAGEEEGMDMEGDMGEGEEGAPSDEGGDELEPGAEPTKNAPPTKNPTAKP
jgi:Bacteriophage T4-like portal protein (Gp20)